MRPLGFGLQLSQQIVGSSNQKIVSGFNICLKHQRPVAVVGGEYAAGPQAAGNFLQSAQRLHPVKGLGAGNDINAAGIEWKLIRIALNK
ncbi:hypothetical protein D3C87_1944470 [compost metagenome]